MKTMDKEFGTALANAAVMAGPVVAGLLIGGAVGAATALLMAPRSGKATRAKIYARSIELRDQATEAVDDAVSQTKARTTAVKKDAKNKAVELRDRIAETH